MNGKRNAPRGIGAGTGTFGGIGLSPSFATIAQSRRVVKSRYDARLSRALDFAVVGVETARNVGERVFWRAVKRALEWRIENGGQV